MLSRYWMAGACFAGLLLVLCGCAGKQPGNAYYRDLEVEWERRDTWEVRVQFWPRRLAHPYTRTSGLEQRKWTYRVVETPKTDDSDRYKIRQRSGSTQYLLLFGDRFNLLEIHRLLAPIDDYWKTRQVRQNPLGNAAFFYRSTSQSHPPVFWYHPAMNRYQFRNTFRVNFSTLGRATGDWITQRVTRTRAGLVFELVHSPSSTRIAFFWPRGEPWWEQAEWYHRERLIALARRVSPPQQERVLPEVTVPDPR